MDRDRRRRARGWNLNENWCARVSNLHNSLASLTIWDSFSLHDFPIFHVSVIIMTIRNERPQQQIKGAFVSRPYDLAVFMANKHKSNFPSFHRRAEHSKIDFVRIVWRLDNQSRHLKKSDRRGDKFRLPTSQVCGSFYFYLCTKMFYVFWRLIGTVLSSISHAYCQSTCSHPMPTICKNC